MRAIDADALIDDCKKYLNKLNPSRDGKECTKIHWLIGILSNASTIEPEQPEVMSDGTLHITGDIDISKVNRILFSQKGTHYGNLYYVDDVEPERKTGKWNTYCHGDIDFSYSCNQCGYSAPYQMIGGEVFQKKWNFCPNCGARMENGKMYEND